MRWHPRPAGFERKGQALKTVATAVEELAGRIDNSKTVEALGRISKEVAALREEISRVRAVVERFLPPSKRPGYKHSSPEVQRLLDGQ